MKRIVSITLHHLATDNEYVSEEMTVDESEFEELKKVVKALVSGCKYAEIESDMNANNQIFYFPNAIVEQSVLSIEIIIEINE